MQEKLTLDATPGGEAASGSGVLTRSMVYRINKEGLILELGKKGLQCSLDTTVVRLQDILLGILSEGESSDDAEGVELVDRQAVPIREEAPIDLSLTLLLTLVIEILGRFSALGYLGGLSVEA
uniref:Uncharacterized protein n=1 Tax=Timema shepardi TaxID=629360 RepID=A0A7R9AWC0_TIMSH|nr:unnamed protein product [Timema shepardi]